MTIDRLSDRTILVTLMRDDMERYGLCFGAQDSGTRRGLTELMRRVGEVCALDHSGKSYLIEALPAGESCLLIISVRQLRRRRVYRVKRVERRACYRFGELDALLDWMRVGGGVSGSLYTYAGGCWLLPDYPPSSRARGRLTEYASVSLLGAIELARIRELGTHIGDAGGRRMMRILTGRHDLPEEEKPPR